MIREPLMDYIRRNDHMKEECLICKAPLEYLESDVLMECEICHKKENSKTRCIHGHYVCNDCHVQGLDAIISICLTESTNDPNHREDDLLKR